MLKNIIGTTGTKIVGAIFSFLIVILTSRYIGAEGVGTISLIVLGITIILHVNSMVGGSGVVYLLPRYNFFTIFSLSQLWALITIILFAIVLLFHNIFSVDYAWHILMLSLIFSFAKVNQVILLGKEKIKAFNILSLLQILLLFLTLIVFIFLLDKPEVFSYIIGLYISYIAFFLLSILYIKGSIQSTRIEKIKEHSAQLFKYGFYVQFANIIQLFNYRLSYYLIDFFITRASLGIYSIGIQFSEGIWLICRSIALVQYARISNTTDAVYAKRITIQLIKASFLVTFLMLIVLLLLPAKFYVYIFGPEFGDVGKVILSLAPGIIAMSVSIMFSHYLSGIGKHYYNMVSNLAGLIATIAFCLYLIPKFGIIGAGMAASASYIVAAIYLFIVFKRISKARLKEFLIRKEDFTTLTNELLKLMSKEKTSHSS